MAKPRRIRSQISLDGPRSQSRPPWSTLMVVDLPLSELSGSWRLAVWAVAPLASASGGVGVLAQAASSAAHATTASNRPIFIKFSNRDAKRLRDAKKNGLSRQSDFSR
ncbi:hypothetical protein D9M71_735610 [compost metagenome]